MRGFQRGTCNKHWDGSPAQQGAQEEARRSSRATAAVYASLQTPKIRFNQTGTVSAHLNQAAASVDLAACLRAHQQRHQQKEAAPHLEQAGAALQTGPCGKTGVVAGYFFGSPGKEGLYRPSRGGNLPQMGEMVGDW